LETKQVTPRLFVPADVIFFKQPLHRGDLATPYELRARYLVESASANQPQAFNDVFGGVAQRQHRTSRVPDKYGERA
jgi:hypothetical protein